MRAPHNNHQLDPVVVGGVGGSGTRLIAQCLDTLGYFIGYDLNESYDNLWFTLLFKRIEILVSPEKEFDELVDIFLTGMIGGNKNTNEQIRLIKKLASKDREQHTAAWLKSREATLLENRPPLPPNKPWGWKEPNTHIIFHRLDTYFPNMKYIHVVRNGLDMAHSKNQNQLMLWGKPFLSRSFTISPYYSLKYWCTTHRRIITEGSEMGERFLLLNYDNFCNNPEKGLQELLDFLEWGTDRVPIGALLKLVRPPDSIGRFKQYGTEIFDREDVNYVKELGFDTFES